MSKFIVTFLLGVFLVPVASQALPLPKKGKQLQVMPLTFTVNYNFAGIVKLSNCSGSLIQFEGAKDSDVALVMTNGHCLEGRDFLKPNEVVRNTPVNRSFGLMDANGRVIGELNASQIVYATMTKTDMTIYKLQETYSSIKANFGIAPLILSSAHPELNQSIEVISGYWRRGYGCHIESFIHELKEDAWSWSDSIRYSRPGCETIGGTSGSPIVLAGTRMVIGINNTGNEDGERCTMNNPCEVDDKGNVGFQKGFSYGQETYLIYTCLNEKREVDLTRAGCALPH